MNGAGSVLRSTKSKKPMGLSSKEAMKRLAKDGVNVLSEKKRISLFKIIFSQFKDFMVLILMASTLISAAMGEITEAITIIAIIILNAILGVVQEYRTEKTMEALKSLAAPHAKVIRDGAYEEIPAEQLVFGDLILLEAGDRVPADAQLIEVNGLMVDESLLTGESVPVEKALESSNKPGNDGDADKSQLYMGTIVTGGRAKAVVNATGMRTEMGKIANMLQDIEEEETPLQKRLEHLGRFIVYGCLVICAIVSAVGVLRGEAVFTMLLSGISLAVAAVPEGLPAVVTIALAIGVRKMLKRNALIRKLPAVETLGCASVICSDKTGTLTENRMTVRKIYTGDRLVELRSESKKDKVEFISGGRRIEPLKNEALKMTLEISAVCNNAKFEDEGSSDKSAVEKVISIFKKQGESNIIGDPTECALLAAADNAGVTWDYLDRNFTRVDEIPFDSDRKCMSIICNKNRGQNFVYTKGAPDVIIEKCTKVMTSKGIINITPSLKSEILRFNDSLAQEALRVIGIAYKETSSRSFNKNEAEDNLVFVGLVGMIDPPRREALDAVRKCKMAGIKPVMITGDHKITAAAIARELEICDGTEKVLTGAELDKMSERELLKAAPSVSVYARVSPKHKLTIVRTLKKLGHIVAMTGDGVNDAPAIKEADIGVSMGQTGTDVTKEASSMILLDDNFATIVSAIEEGRVIYSNIRKFIRYMLACNIGEVLTMFLGMLLGLPIPLLPIQILWVNLVTDGLPAIALGLDPPEKDSMLRRPRGANESIFSQGLLRLILFRGIIIGLSTLAVFGSILYFTGDEVGARTGAFVTLVMTQLIHVFECKSERKSIFEIPVLNNMALVLSVLCSLVMILGVIYIPFLQQVFKTAPLTMEGWLLVIGFSAVGPILASFIKVNRKYYNYK